MKFASMEAAFTAASVLVQYTKRAGHIAVSGEVNTGEEIADRGQQWC